MIATVHVHPTSANVGGDAPSVTVRISTPLSSQKNRQSFTVRIGLAALETTIQILFVDV